MRGALLHPSLARSLQYVEGHEGSSLLQMIERKGLLINLPKVGFPERFHRNWGAQSVQFSDTLLSLCVL